MKKEQETTQETQDIPLWNVRKMMRLDKKEGQEIAPQIKQEKIIIDLMMILLTSQAYQVVESSLYERAKLILKNDFDLVQNLINSLSKD